MTAGRDAAIVAGDAVGVAAAVAELRRGGIVAVPTETVYGLAGDATDARAVAAIYAAKGRPGFNPLIVHVADLAAAGELVEIGPVARALADRFWPGPLTLVLPLRAGSGIAAPVTAGLPTLAVRMPAHPVMRAILRDTGRPLAAPSANASGGISPTTAAHVRASLGDRIPLIVDGGPCASGIESSIVRVDGDRVTLLRPGAIPAASLGINAATGAGIVAPGQMASHYAPRQPVRLDVTTAAADEYLIGFGAVAGDISLSRSGDPVEAAAALFAALHTAQASGCARIAVAPVPEEGVGAAINDRLRRAAAGRSLLLGPNNKLRHPRESGDPSPAAGDGSPLSQG